MKRLLLVFVFLFIILSSYSQQLSQVSFSGGSDLSCFSLLSDREVLVRISNDGSILEWGIEVQSMRDARYYAPKLQLYIGRVDYYGPESDSVSRGKLRSIGSSVITYYGAYETAEKIGKIRTIGSLFLDYYDFFAEKNLRGKLKSIGNTNIEYYSAFAGKTLEGKLRAVGPTAITYYSSFEDKLIRGKIKSIGTASYSWHTSFETHYGGGLKTGSYRQIINGITYILQ